MNFWLIGTKIFALIFFLFVSPTATSAQTNSIYQLSAGTIFRLAMDNEISSKVARVNDTFTATIAAPLIKREKIVLPIGTIIEGRVTKVRRASFGGRGGILEISFQTIRFADGTKRTIEGVLVSELKTNSGAAANALTILGGTAIGGIVGAAAAKSGGGALIGAGIGAGAGMSVSLFRKGGDVSIRADEQFEIKLTKAVNLPVPDF